MSSVAPATLPPDPVSSSAHTDGVVILMKLSTTKGVECYLYYDMSSQSFYLYAREVIGGCMEEMKQVTCEIMCIKASEPVVITVDENVDWTSTMTVYIRPCSFLGRLKYYGKAYKEGHITKIRLIPCNEAYEDYDARLEPNRDLLCTCTLDDDGTISFNLSNRIIVSRVVFDRTDY
jgi:hypothetical protein